MKKSRRTINLILALTICAAMVFSLIPANADAAAKIKLSKCTVSLSYVKDVYTGNKKTPRVTVKYKGKKLKSGTDYSVTYKNNVNPGTAKVIVKGKGKYTGTVTKTCKIYVKAVKSITAKVVSGDAIQLSWKKATGSKKYKIKVTADGSKYKKGTYSTTSSSYKFTEVPSGKTYKFAITSYAGPNSTASKTKYVSITLEKVGSLAAPSISGKSPGYRRNDLTWGSVTKASGYSVEEVNKSSGAKTTKEFTENSASFYEKSKGTTYEYKVRAFTTVDGEKVYGKYSKTISITAKGTYIGQACSNYDGKAGDGSGNEVKKSNWSYSSSSTSPYNWTYCFRFKDPAKAELAAKNVEKGIANNLIGYSSKGTSEYGSAAVQKQVEKYGWDLSKVTKKTGFSCGDLITASVKYSGITSCSYTGAGLAVAKELKRLSGDFTCYSDKKYVASDAYLQRGDILVTAHSNGKHNHVCMVL